MSERPIKFPPKTIQKEKPAETKPKRSNGRKKVWTEEQFHILQELCARHCTQAEIEGVMDTDRDVINRLCIEHYTTDPEFPMTLKRVQERYKGRGKAKLREFQWKAVEKGSVPMLIWLGKNYLHQKDNPEVNKGIDEIKNNISDLTEILKNPKENRDINNL